MWDGKKKAITFSFDDGVVQDAKVIKMFDDYGLKGTFNLNSGNLGKVFYDVREVISPERVKETYRGHEVAVHTVNHLNLTTLSEEDILLQVNEDKKALESLVGYEIRGMAYPCGGVNNDARVADVLRRGTTMRYARTITSSEKFAPQDNLLQFQPTTYYIHTEKTMALAKRFVEEEEEGLLYIWGHAYELDESPLIDWKFFEKLCKYLSGREDIFYGTNAQVLL